MAGKAFENLNKIFLSDTFRAWFDKTNQIVSTINPLEIYGITNDQGEFSGITFTIDNNGIATLGFKFPGAVTGDLIFNGGVTFNSFVGISGSTLELNPNGGHGATVYGRVVRTVNGATGDVNLDFIAIPGTSADGDIVYYENSGSGATFRSYNLFSDGTADAGMFHIGGSGGIFVGVTANGSSAADAFIKYGNIQLVGTTASGIYLTDNSQGTLNTAKIAGADIRYGTETGSQIFTIAGRNISGQKHSSDNFVIDFNNQTVSIAGAGTGPASLNVGDKSTNGRPFTYTDTNGATFSLKYLIAGETGPGRTSGGFTGLAAFGGNPSTKGLNDDQRVRLEYTAGSVEVEIAGGGKTSGFAVMGKEISNGPYGDALLPTLVARRDGNVVIGGIAPTDGGITGTSFGGLNIASGKLLVGGSAGAAISDGFQVLTSNGSTASWNFEGNIAMPLLGTITTANVINIVSTGQNAGAFITPLDENRNPMKGSFSATFHFPPIRRVGRATPDAEAVFGVRMSIDSNDSVDKFVKWNDLSKTSLTPFTVTENELVSKSFTFSGIAEERVTFTPFMTAASSTNQLTPGFLYLVPGSFLISFNRLGK